MTSKRKFLAGAAVAGAAGAWLAAWAAGAALVAAGALYFVPDNCTKQDGPWRSFNERWFAEHQAALVRLLNAPATRAAARWALCADVPEGERVAAVGPNRVTWGARRVAGGVQATTCFRVHPKHAKALYHRGKGFAWLAHLAWDPVADWAAPAWSVGLSSLDFRPDPHPESNSCDGTVYLAGQDTTWATIVNYAPSGSNLDASATTTDVGMSSSTTTNQWSAVYRTVHFFDTSSLTASATISAADYSAFTNTGASTDELSVAPTFCCYACTSTSTTGLGQEDYHTTGSTDKSATIYTWATISTQEQYHDFPLNDLTLVSKTSLTRLAIKTRNYDAQVNAPAWSCAPGDPGADPPVDPAPYTTALRLYAADQTGTTNDPKLSVTYSIPAGAMGSALLLGGD